MLAPMIEPTAIPCPPNLRPAALARLHAAEDPSQQEGLAEAIAAAQCEGETAFGGLFVAGDPPQAACWLQRTAGNTAMVWPPAPSASQGPALLQAAAQFAADEQIAVAQINVAERDHFDPAVLASAGFAQLARLLYLYADVAKSRSHHADAKITCEFVGHADQHPQQLAALIEETYAGTLDCPALDGARTSADVLAGYREQGTYLPQHWYRVMARGPNGRPVGVLILSSHASTGNWELVYMGVVPAARGQGLGRAIVEFALDAAARGGAERLVLAVDADNTPAVGTYHAAGFVEWDRRVVFARLAENATVRRGA
jgi:ribosomal protein S18 acetylase RimI-like enzyme